MCSKDSNRNHRLIRSAAAVLLILISCSFVARLLAQFMQSPNELNGIGFTDAIEYWSAFKIWQAGGNPYDDQSMLQFQSKIRPSQYAIMMWNPPWLLPLFSPLFSISSYLAFARVWAATSTLAYIIGNYCLLSCFAPRHLKNAILWVVLFSFAPFLFTLSFGQVSCWLFLGASLTLVGIQRGKVIVLALGSVLLSLKPHLFIVFIACTTVLFVTRKNWRLLLALYVPPIMAAGVTDFISTPHITTAWLNTILGRTPPILTPQPQRWITTTIPSVLCQWLSITDLEIEYYIGFVSLALTLVISLWLLYRYRVQYALAYVLLVSLPLGPFGWLYDYTVVVSSIVILWPQISKNEERLNSFLCGCLILVTSCTLLVDRLDHALLPLLLVISILIGSTVGDEGVRKPSGCIS